jgi:hypothetical protein
MNRETILWISLIMWGSILFAGPNLQASDAVITRERPAAWWAPPGISTENSLLVVASGVVRIVSARDKRSRLQPPIRRCKDACSAKPAYHPDRFRCCPAKQSPLLSKRCVIRRCYSLRKIAKLTAKDRLVVTLRNQVKCERCEKRDRTTDS